jgi:hypothetical protein
MSDTDHSTDLEKLQEQLRQHLGSRLRELRLTLHQGHLLVQGRAVSYYVKQLAQHLLRRSLATTPLINHIDVQPLVHPPEPDDAEVPSR